MQRNNWRRNELVPEWKSLRYHVNNPPSYFIQNRLNIMQGNNVKDESVTYDYGSLSQGHLTSIFGKYLFGRRFEI